MTDYRLKSKFLTVTISNHGAQLSSVKANNGGYEYLWQADPEVWGRHAPILFPIVGRLKDDRYSFNGNEYRMNQHGFVRDLDWELVFKDQEQMIFQVQSNDETYKIYPFEFKLRVTYQLHDFDLSVNYQVENTDKKILLFSIGGHPAFNADFANSKIVANRRRFYRYSLKGNYLDLSSKREFDFGVARKITRSDFSNDAIILKTVPGMTEIMLEASLPDEQKNGEKKSHRPARISLSADDTEFIGIWSKNTEQAKFVAIEPWWGVADTTGSDGVLKDKYGILALQSGQSQNFKYSIGFL